MIKHPLIFGISFVALIGMIGAQDCLPDGITFSTQGQIDSFSINYAGCSHVQGPVIIEELVDGAISNLDGLSQIRSIGGYLRVFFNDALTSLSGLDDVTSIGEYVLLTDNDGLTSLHGLDNLTSIGDFLFLSTNDALTNLHGLEKVTSIGGYILITYNTGLISLSGLDNLTSVGGFLFMDTNTALTSLHGLEQLATIGGAFSIRFNPSLSNLDALGHLTSIGGSLHVGDNDVLTRLTGLDNIDHTTITELILENSPNLSLCEVQSICTYLSESGNTATITGNANGCNTIAEVQAACDIASVVRVVNDSHLEFYPNPGNGLISVSGVSEGQLIVMNSLGQVIRNGIFAGAELDISEWPGAIYYIQICSGEQCAGGKLIKN